MRSIKRCGEPRLNIGPSRCRLWVLTNPIAFSALVPNNQKEFHVRPKLYLKIPLSPPLGGTKNFVTKWDDYTEFAILYCLGWLSIGLSGTIIDISDSNVSIREIIKIAMQGKLAVQARI
jgi:hypothetical protein